MIVISGRIIHSDEIAQQLSLNAIERKALDLLAENEEIYAYPSLRYLKFELDLRYNIVSAAKEQNAGKMSFRTFRKSICNPEFWDRTDEGGFSLKAGVLPSKAIQDIFTNSAEYGTECATAMVIVYYKALLNIFPEKLFNELFSNIYLMNWKLLDKDLGIRAYKKPPAYLPGDCRYFENPDVDPLTPEWQGENVIDLGGGMFYGHGIGIGTTDEFVKELNEFRKSGATTSARLLDSVTLPDFRYLATRYLNFV